MCADISLQADIEYTHEIYPDLRDIRLVDLTEEELEHTNAMTFPLYDIIYQDHGTVLTTMEWGVRPNFEKDPEKFDLRRRSMINARIEKIVDDPKSYWKHLRQQRCLIPVSGIFEHRSIRTWKNKVPYYIWQRNRAVFHLPGLFQWDMLPDADGVVHQVGSFTLITTKGNQTMSQIHNEGDNKFRMPLFLTPELEKAWLSPDLTENDLRDLSHFELPSEGLSFHPVYTLRGKSHRPDGKKAYDEWHWENLPPLGNDNPLTPQLSIF